MNDSKVVIIGAGPAGLTAAYELVQKGVKPLVLEKSKYPGGIARTEFYNGYRFDIGGHRFYTKIQKIQKLWQDMLGEDFIEVPRLSRIYYAGKYYQYPLEFANALFNLGIWESFKIFFSYVWAKLAPPKAEDTFDQWVTRRFGKWLYETFFKTYTEKVWGIPCNVIRADWAAQRIKGLSLRTAVWNALTGSHQTKSLIKKFHYPVLGPGMMWERFQKVIEKEGGTVRFETSAVRFIREGRFIKSVIVRQGKQEEEISADYFISTLPVNHLVLHLDPPPPIDVLTAARELNHRAFILVGLILKRRDVFPDNWIYVHSPGVKVGRIQNFKNWSLAMVADPSKTSLGMEYFCNEEDDTWLMPDKNLIALASREVELLGLARQEDVEDGVVIRQPKAYPVYDGQYQKSLRVIQGFLATLDNLQTIGRNGMHRYNNQDHSMLTAMLAVKNLFGEDHDLWNVNTERSYYEEFTSVSVKK